MRVTGKIIKLSLFSLIYILTLFNEKTIVLGNEFVIPYGQTEFVPGDGPVNPVDPNLPNPDEPVNPVDPINPEGPKPGTPGPLSIDYVSSIFFDHNKISNANMTYFARPQYYYTDDGSINSKTYSKNYVQVTDNRGVSTGWKLSVKQLKQFESSSHHLLEGAQIDFTRSKASSNLFDNEARPTVYDATLVPGESVVMMQAFKEQGNGTWVNGWGKVESLTVDNKVMPKNTGVLLNVPGKTKKEASTYATTFMWTLTDSP